MSSITSSIASTTIAELGAMPKRRSQLGMVLRSLRQQPVALAGLAIVLGWLLLTKGAKAVQPPR